MITRNDLIETLLAIMEPFNDDWLHNIDDEEATDVLTAIETGRALLIQTQNEGLTCAWTRDKDPDMATFINTACGHRVDLFANDLFDRDNLENIETIDYFCPFCGRTIVEIKA